MPPCNCVRGWSSARRKTPGEPRSPTASWSACWPRADERMALIGVKMEGAARRLELVGQAHGDHRHAAQGRWQVRLGRVPRQSGAGRLLGHLVRALRAEVPNVKKNYARITTRALTWWASASTTARGRREVSRRSERSPGPRCTTTRAAKRLAANYYGVMGIPDRDPRGQGWQGREHRGPWTRAGQAARASCSGPRSSGRARRADSTSRDGDETSVEVGGRWPHVDLASAGLLAACRSR